MANELIDGLTLIEKLQSARKELDHGDQWGACFNSGIDKAVTIVLQHEAENSPFLPHAAEHAILILDEIEARADSCRRAIAIIQEKKS